MGENQSRKVNHALAWVKVLQSLFGCLYSSDSLKPGIKGSLYASLREDKGY